jgi:hypothetical protein
MIPYSNKGAPVGSSKKNDKAETFQFHDERSECSRMQLGYEASYEHNKSNEPDTRQI